MVKERQGPFFNLKAVVQQTGLQPDTLRAWERRYGLPSPGRSAGGHRLYTQEDIEIVRWLMARQREGITIRRAVDLWRQLQADGQNPLEEARAPVAPPESMPAVGDTLIDLRHGWLDACRAYREQEAEQILAQAFALYSPEVVALEVLQKGVAAIGEGWYRGDVTVQQEHFCTALAMRRVEALILACPLPTRPERILAACPPDEEHSLALLLVTLLLRRKGWDVIYLGANVPQDRLDATVASTQPHLVILTAQRLPAAASLQRMARQVQAEGVPVAFGGRVFSLQPDLRARIAGHFLGEQLQAVPERVEALLAAPRPIVAPPPAPKPLTEAIRRFSQHQGAIEAQVEGDLAAVGISPDHLSIAHRELASHLCAALELGDSRWLGTDLAWLGGLLENYRLPRGLLNDYMRAYLDAARQQLDGEGEPIVAWLEQVLEANGWATGRKERA